MQIDKILYTDSLTLILTWQLTTLGFLLLTKTSDISFLCVSIAAHDFHKVKQDENCVAQRLFDEETSE